jgi:hypothetical protein
MEVSGQLHTSAALLSGKEGPVNIGYRARWAHSRSGRGGKENKIPFPVEKRTPVVQPIA